MFSSFSGGTFLKMFLDIISLNNEDTGNSVNSVNCPNRVNSANSVDTANNVKTVNTANSGTVRQ